MRHLVECARCTRRRAGSVRGLVIGSADMAMGAEEEGLGVKLLNPAERCRW